LEKQSFPPQKQGRNTLAAKERNTNKKATGDDSLHLLFF
jgi:hypothetical protein